VGNGAQKEFSVCTGHNRVEVLISDVCSASVSFVIKTPKFLQDILVSAALYKIANEMSVVQNILFFSYHNAFLLFIHGTKFAHSRHVCNYVHITK
jgi:hypothetical protein